MAGESEKPWHVSDDGTPGLRGMRCESCGNVAFPAQTYGCIRCGAHGDRLQAQDIIARGEMLTFAVVRSHPSHAVPFTLAEIQLDAGPIVRAQLDASLPQTPGIRVVATVVDDDAGGHLEFVAEGSR